MPKSFASFISYIFHPLLFPTYGAAFIIYSNPHLFAAYKGKGQFLWIIITFIMTFILPVVWLVMMKKLELIDNLKLENPQQRIIPYIATASFYMWTFKLFQPTNEATPYSNILISKMMLGASVALFIGFFINIFNKISLHTLGAGNLIGLVLSTMRISDYDLKLFFIFTLVLAGVIGTARLILKAHEEKEILTGYFVGFIGQFFAFSILPLFLK